MTKVKICGIRRFSDVEWVNEAKPDFAGFVFAESSRQVDFNRAYLLRSELRKEIRTVGVFVNEDPEFIRKCCEAGIIDLIQLHGDEDERYVAALRTQVSRPLIKAVRVGRDFEARRLTDFENGRSPLYDYPLFDAQRPGAYGGTGQTFDWEPVKDCGRPFFLAGGLHAGNLAEAVRTASPYCVDISSGVETDGAKDREKILEAVRIVRALREAARKPAPAAALTAAAVQSGRHIG